MQVWDLRVGGGVRILKAFHDFDGVERSAGTVLVLESRDFFPYDGGHTLKFTDGTIIRLSENDPANEAVLQDTANEFWELVPASE